MDKSPLDHTQLPALLVGLSAGFAIGVLITSVVAIIVWFYRREQRRRSHL